MDQATRTQLEDNIFPAAHQACVPWERFPWQTRAHLAHSSQALAIDVFGTIKTSAHRDIIVDALAQTMKLPTGGPWDITLEWKVRPTLFNESRPTQVDVYVESPHSIMLFECQCTESDRGTCSQTVKRNGVQPCDGNYEINCTDEHDTSSRCALTEKGIQYWDIIPKVFHLDADTDYQPCPFAGATYQWMRNLVVAYKVGRQKNKQPAVVMVYADLPRPPMTQKIRSRDWTTFTKTVRQDHVSVHRQSYQEILRLVQEVTPQDSGEQTLWRELSEWVERKMTAIKSDRKTPKRTRSASSKRLVASQNA